ncbi:unnamed protein product [Schistocephalus solidus]|uniref:Uncharacterized protein n=1 Tax=Schistocephalus solidus TaxID=70667 RepID=A0A183TCQ1_SCHSO|nr:unnamed protein product [Schistocephalus solidus]
MAKQDLEHGSAATKGIPNASSMEILSWILLDRRSSVTLQGRSEDFPRASAEQPIKLGGRPPEPNSLEEDSKEQQSMKPTKSRLQSQKGGKKVTSALNRHRECPSPPTIPALPAHLPRMNHLVRHLQTQCKNNPTTSTSASISDNPPIEP